MATASKKIVKKATKAKAPVKKTAAKPKPKTDKPTKAAQKVMKTATPKAPKLPAWEVALSVLNPGKGYGHNRPRRTSLHTLATIVGAKDPLALAEEMRKSGKVVGYVCPDVQTPIFYLKRLSNIPGMIDTRDDAVWGKWRYPDAGAESLQDFVEKNPYPRIKGFRRFAREGKGYWTGGGWGLGQYVVTNKSGMEKPYQKPDYPYAREIIKALKAAGYKPGIKISDVT